MSVNATPRHGYFNDQWALENISLGTFLATKVRERPRNFPQALQRNTD